MARVVFTADRSPSARQLSFLQEKLSEALRQLRLALGSGVIFYGLEVYPATDNAIQVLPGLAFDGQGDPLVVHRPVRVPLPAQLDRPRILALRYRPVPVEQTPEGMATLEDDGVELVWLATPPADDNLVPLATIRPERQGRIVVESEVARRAAAASHRHSGALVSDGAGRQRYDGDAVGGEPPAPMVSPADLNLALTRLRRELLDRIEGGDRPAPPPASAVPTEPDYGWEPEIQLIEGIGTAYAQQLAGIGVATAPQLLARGHTRVGRQELSRATGIGSGRLEAWARAADLLRLHGVAPEHVRLLLDAGFDSVADLAGVEAEVVTDRIRAVFNPERHLLGKPPRPALIRAWVQEARRLPAITFE